MNSDENRYFEKIDCRLNYYSKEELVTLFEEARLISPITVFRFLEELINPSPLIINSKKIKRNIGEVLMYIDSNFNHPAKNIVFTSAVAKLQKNHLPIRKSVKLLNEIRINYRGYYSLLNIVVFSTRRNKNVIILEHLYDSIISEWSFP
jgi:hypothetical protein